MSVRTVIIAQARMSSGRLSGKTLMDLAGEPMIDRVVERARRAVLPDDVWVATTTDFTDDVLAAHLEALGVPCFRGSLDDVLGRYVGAAEASNADVIVRIACDCPLIDPDVIDAVIGAYRVGPDVEYCTNTLKRTYPIGMDTEVFSRSALERAHREASKAYEREHVTPYIYQHPELFQLRSIEAPDWAVWPELRLTVDEAADLEMLQAVIARVGQGAGLRQVLQCLSADEELAAMNARVVHRHVEKPLNW